MNVWGPGGLQKSIAVGVRVSFWVVSIVIKYWLTMHVLYTNPKPYAHKLAHDTTDAQRTLVGVRAKKTLLRRRIFFGK